MIKTSRSFVLLAIAMPVMLSLSCKKEEGEGGTSTITGKVIVHDFDAGYQQVNPSAIYPAPHERVYIIYGADGAAYDDDVRTSYDGSYQFKYLQKGKYRIFTYTKDTTGAYNGSINFDAPDVPVFADVEITSNGSTVTASDLIILDNNY